MHSLREGVWAHAWAGHACPAICRWRWGQHLLTNWLPSLFFGNLTSPRQWPAPLKPTSLWSALETCLSSGIFRGSCAVWSGYSVEQSASLTRTDDVNPNIQNKCVYSDMHQNDLLSFRTRTELNWSKLWFDYRRGRLTAPASKKRHIYEINMWKVYWKSYFNLQCNS